MAFGISNPASGESSNFPPPNYINPTTRVPVALGLVISTCILVLLVISGRLYARSRIKTALGIDDWMILAAAVLAIALSVLGATSCLYGLGYHLWDIRPEWTEPYYKIGFGFQLIYPICVGLTKMSICQTYLRIFPSEASRTFSHGMTAFVAAYTITCIFLMLFQCRPIQGYWQDNLEQKCVDMHANMISIGAINTVTDFLVYLWPAKYLWRIQLPLRQRIGLVFVFTCGLVVCIAGVIRLVYLNRYFTNIDLFWDAALTTSISIVEVNIGIVCGCLPCVKPLLTKLLPSIFNTGGRTSRTTRSGPTSVVQGPSYRFRDLSTKYADKGGSTSALREERLENVDEESDGNSTHSSTKPVLEYQAGAETGVRDKSTLPARGIVVDQTVSVERSDNTLAGNA